MQQLAGAHAQQRDTCNTRREAQPFEAEGFHLHSTLQIQLGAACSPVVCRRDAAGHLWMLKALTDESGQESREVQIATALADEPWAVPVERTFRVVVKSHTGQQLPATVLQMPLLQGGDLRARLMRSGSGKPMDAGEAMLYIVQAVNALRNCHACGILHRDVKADNFMIQADGQLRLGDFGMAGFISPADSAWRGVSGCDTRTTTSTAAQIPGGSLEILSPARLLGGDDGTAGDWWSLGVMVLELLAGIPSDDTFWPFQPREVSMHAARALLGQDPSLAHGEGAVTGDMDASSLHVSDVACLSGRLCTLAWLEAAHARDVAFTPAVSSSGRELVLGLLHPSPVERWGLEEVLACSFFPDRVFECVAERFPCIADDMRQLRDMRNIVRKAKAAAAARSSSGYSTISPNSSVSSTDQARMSACGSLETDAGI